MSTSKKTILVLEDEMLVGLDLEASLTDAGYCVTLARSCEKAADFLASNRPDLAVLDVRLGDGECVVAARKLVEQGVPFIVHTGLLRDSHDAVFKFGTVVTKLPQLRRSSNWQGRSSRKPDPCRQSAT